MTTPNGAPPSPVTIVHKSGPGASKPATPAAAPAAAPPAAAPPADPIAEAKRYRDEAQAKLDAVEKKTRVQAAEIRKFTDEKRGLGAKLSEYEQLKKQVAEYARLDGQAKLNKAAFLEAKFGKDWYDQIVTERMNGGAPTADTVALEVAKVEERFKAELAERDRKAEEARAESKRAQDAADLRAYHDEAAAYAKDAVKEFPILERLGDAKVVGAALVRRAQTVYAQTAKRDDSGAIVETGRLMTFKEAAEALEEQLISIAEGATSHDKYRPRLTGGAKPANPAGTGGPQLRSTEVERRTLSNGLTASTPGQKRPSRSDDERRAAAFAAVDELKNRQA